MCAMASPPQSPKEPIYGIASGGDYHLESNLKQNGSLETEEQHTFDNSKYFQQNGPNNGLPESMSEPKVKFPTCF